MQRQPVGVEAQPLFYIAHLPVQEWTIGHNRTPTCDARRASDSASWFAADSAADALRAANMFRMAEDEVRAGRLSPAPCEGGGAAHCRQWVLSLDDDPSKITGVEACPATGRDGACYVLSFGSGEELTIAGTIPGGAWPAHITPTSITSIQVDLVMTLSV
jgi:hypothetical protein